MLTSHRKGKKVESRSIEERMKEIIICNGERRELKRKQGKWFLQSASREIWNHILVLRPVFISFGQILLLEFFCAPFALLLGMMFARCPLRHCIIAPLRRLLVFSTPLHLFAFHFSLFTALPRGYTLPLFFVPYCRNDFFHPTARTSASLRLLGVHDARIPTG